ncbi:alginate lyase family protein [Pedobacter chinensis]|nr:alginate lyase family protein [Pedobacter chinensis]
MMKDYKLNKALVLFVVLGAISFCVKGQLNHSGPYLMDELSHQQNVELFKKKDKDFLRKVQILVKKSDIILKNPNYSVTFFKDGKIAPSGNKHDYYSISTYHDLDEKGNIRFKDGKRNSSIRDFRDKQQLWDMVVDLQVLSLTYYFTKDERYGKKARELLSVFFLNKETAMNPNLNYAQVRPDTKLGTFSGLVDVVVITQIPDIFYLFKGSKNFDNQFTNRIVDWFKQYLQWLQQSKPGKIASIQKNNQVNYYNTQVAVFKLFTGRDPETVKKEVYDKAIKSVQIQIDSEGKQPLELKRATPIGYSVYNLKGIMLLASLSDNIKGKDIWNYSYNGSSLKSALQWLNKTYKDQGSKNIRVNANYETITSTTLWDLYMRAIPRIKGLQVDNTVLNRKNDNLLATYFMSRNKLK